MASKAGTPAKGAGPRPAGTTANGRPTPSAPKLATTPASVNKRPLAAASPGSVHGKPSVSKAAVPAKRARLEPASDEDEEGDDAIDDDEDDEDAGDDDAGDDEEGEEIDEDDEEEEGEEEEEGDEEEEEEEGDDIEEDDEEDEDTRPTSAPAKKAAAPMAKPAKPAADEDEQGKDSKVTFKSLGLTKALCDACAAMKWTAPTQIQRDAIPVALQGRDIIGLAKTGSGKTGAFALPILEALLKNPQPLFALVLAPTRELAFQIAENFEGLGANIGVRTAVIVGGVDNMTQAIALSKRPHIVIGTPGRIVDHLENTKGFHLRTLKFLVMDEADRLLHMDFEEEINKILKVIPAQRRTYLFSATMTTKVAKLQRASLTDPVKIEVATKYSTVETLLQYYVFIPSKFKDVYLTFILNELAGNTVIVFTNTQASTQRLALMLRNLGFSAIPLHGALSQPQRLGALNKFKSGSRKILLATDVASRGLDIPAVDVVVNYDLPQHSKDYIHRVGRTARAGRSGKSITFVTQYDVELFQRIEELIQRKMEQFPCREDQVLLLSERVSEAQRIAALDMKDAGFRKGAGAGDDGEEEDAGKARRPGGGGRGGGRGRGRAGGGGAGGRGGRGGRGRGHKNR